MKTVVEMALDTGFDADDETTLTSLVHFAELVRADAIAEERKACAKECKFGRSSADIEQAIRARGEASKRSNT